MREVTAIRKEKTPLIFESNSSTWGQIAEHTYFYMTSSSTHTLAAIAHE